MKGLKYISIILIVLLMITACSSNVNIEDGEVEDEVVEEHVPADGGTLVLSTTRFKTLNPIFNRNEDLFQIQHLIYESLVTFSEDMSIEPLLAEGWEFTNGEYGQSIDFKLRRGIKWHDGETLTADDVIFTFNLIKGNIKGISKVSIYKQSLEYITNIVKVDDNTVRVNFSKNIGNGLEMMTFPILPEHIFEGNKIQLLEQDDFNIVGTGAYELKEYEKMRSISLVRNDNYWKNKPYIDKINVLIVPDEEAQLSLFENGGIDFVNPKVVDWGKYVDEKTTNSAEFITPNYEFLGINFRKNILHDLNIRKGIAYSIDREKITGNIYLGHSTVVDFPILPNSWLYDDSKIQLGFNPNLAGTFLDEAGYILDENNNLRVNEKGDIIQLKLITNANNSLREQTALLIQEDLKKVGIQLDVEFLEWEDFEKQMNTGNFDLILGGWELSYIPDITSAFHSSKIGGTNFIAYSNEKLDSLLDSYLGNGDLTSKKQRFSEIEEHLVTELPYISLFFRNGAVLVNNKIKGDPKPQSYNIFANIEEWYIDVKK